MSADRYCAYNETRQRFVASDVEAADGSSGGADARLLEMEPGGDAALWISPYRQISPSSARFPLDLVYLDEHFVVLDTVEFFPMNQGGAAIVRADSVLVLAADRLAKTGVRVGDQLALSKIAEAAPLERGSEDGKAQEIQSAAEVLQQNDGELAEFEANGAQHELPFRAVDAAAFDGGRREHQLTAAHVTGKEEPVPCEPVEVASRENARKLPAKEEPIVVSMARNGTAAAPNPAEQPARKKTTGKERDGKKTRRQEIAAALPLAEEPVNATSENGESESHQVANALPEKRHAVVVSITRNLTAPEPITALTPEEKEPAAVTSDGTVVVEPDTVAEKSTRIEPAAQKKQSEGSEPAPPAAEPPEKRQPSVVPISRNGAAAAQTPATIPAASPAEAPDWRVPAVATNSQRLLWTKDLVPRNWLERWLYPELRDPRSSARESLPGMVAYYFTGGLPKPQEVRNISTSGLYLVTAERWYKGTAVQLTLTDRVQSTIERSITVFAKVVRFGGDGVGFKFVLEEDQHKLRHHVLELYAPTNGITSGMIGRFVQNFKTMPQHAD